MTNTLLNTGQPLGLSKALDELHSATSNDPEAQHALASVIAHMDRRSRVLEDLSLHAFRYCKPIDKPTVRIMCRAGRAMCDDWQTGEVPA